MSNISIQYFNADHDDMEFIYVQNSIISYPLHNHIRVFTIGYVISGTVNINFSSEIMKYTKGSAYLIHPYQTHSIYSEVPCDLLVLCIQTDFIMNNTCQQVIDIVLQKTNILIKDNMFPKFNQSPMIASINKLYQEPYTKQLDEQVELLIKSLEQYPEREFSLDQLSQEVYISKYYMIKKFKINCGLTPHKFMIQNRIRKSKQLIIKNQSLTDIAMAIGFYDQSHFIRHFKHIVGLTPNEYKIASKRISDKTQL